MIGEPCSYTPNVQVQQSLRLLFNTFWRTASACATVKHFREQSLLFPRPAGKGTQTSAVLWRPLTLASAVSALHNPRYAGAFAFGRRRSHKRIDGGFRTTKTAREQWHALLLDAHPGYISWQDYEQIEQQLRSSAVAFGLERRKAPPREGPALLQGLVLCGVCGSRMSVRYHDRTVGLVPDYICQINTMKQRQPPCQIIAGASVDAAIAQLLVQEMTLMTIDITLAEADWNEKLSALDVVRQHAERQRNFTLSPTLRRRELSLSRGPPASVSHKRAARRHAFVQKLLFWPA